MLLEELPPEAGSQKVSQWKGKQDCNLAKAAADTVNVSGACQFLVCNDFHTFVRVALTKSSLKVFTTAPLVVFHGSLPFRVRRLFDSRRGSVRAPKKSYMKRRPLARPHRLVRVMSMPFLAQYHPINASAFSQHCITTGRVHVAQCAEHRRLPSRNLESLLLWGHHRHLHICLCTVPPPRVSKR